MGNDLNRWLMLILVTIILGIAYYYVDKNIDSSTPDELQQEGAIESITDPAGPPEVINDNASALTPTAPPAPPTSTSVADNSADSITARAAATADSLAAAQAARARAQAIDNSRDQFLDQTAERMRQGNLTADEARVMAANLKQQAEALKNDNSGSAEEVQAREKYAQDVQKAAELLQSSHGANTKLRTGAEALQKSK